LEIINYTNCPVCGSHNLFPVFEAKDYTVSSRLFALWECKHCSLRFTQDAPAAAFIGQYYQSDNYISHSDTKQGLVNTLYHHVRKRTLTHKQKLIARITGQDKGSLLDIGSGTGAFASHMEKAGWKVMGLEPDEQTRRRAHERYSIQLKPSEELFSISPGSYDAVTMWHVLEHVHDLHGYIHQLQRILKVTGKAFIAVPNYTSYDASVYKQYWAAYDVPRHLYHFSPAAMKMLLTKHQLKLLRTEPMWYDSFYVSMLSEKYKTGAPGYMKAFFSGISSNLRAAVDKEKCSSLIYVIEKNL